MPFQTSNDTETLLGAAQSGNLGTMRRLLCKGQDPNCEGMFNFSYNDGSRVYNGMTTQGLAAVYFAIANNQEAMVDLLLSYGLKLDARNYSHTNPLEAATLARSVSMIRKCLEHGAYVDVMNHYGKTALYVAADENLPEVADVLLKSGASPNAQEKELSWGPLHKAVFHGNLKIVKSLIKAGADVNLLTSDHDTPLHMAAWKNRADVAKILIEAGAKVNKGRKDNQTPLFVASAYHNPEVAAILIEHKADVNARDNHGRTPLHNVATTKDIDFAKLLVLHGADMTVKNNSGDTPVHLAALKGQIKMLKFLHKRGADLSQKGWGGCTVLHDAASEGHTDVVRMILKINSDKKFIDLADNGEMTALGSSVTRDSKEIAELLLNAGANPNIRYRSEMKNTILHWAAFNNSKNCMKLLLNRRLLKVDETNLQGTTPLHVAAMKGYTDLMKMLLNYGADPSKETSEGDSLLHLALIESQGEVVRFLLESDLAFRFSLNAENGRGSTALSIACEKRNLEAVELLLKAGADASRWNKHGRCALHYAAGHGDLKIGKLLVRSLRQHQREEIINHPTKEGWTALHMAAEFQHYEFVRWLLANGADITCHSIDGYTPLHMAVKKNSTKLLELLLSHGVDLDVKTKMGATVMHVASACGSTSVVDMLLSLAPEQLEAHEKPHDATPLISALSQGNCKTAMLLLQKGANPLVETSIWQDTPLDFAAHSGLTDSVRRLIKAGANVYHAGLMGRSALHWAAISGSEDVIIELLRHGINPHAKDIYGFTALELAEQQGKKEAASILKWWPSHFRPQNDVSMSLRERDETPDRFICPIAQVMMSDPVFAADGFAYEKSHIKVWLEQSTLSPMTRRKLSNNDLVPATRLRQEIENFTNNLKNL